MIIIAYVTPEIKANLIIHDIFKIGGHLGGRRSHKNTHIRMITNTLKPSFEQSGKNAEKLSM